MHSDTDTINQLSKERVDLMMRSAYLCGRVMALAEIMGGYLREMEASPDDPAHIENFRHIQESLTDALNEYNDADKPF